MDLSALLPSKTEIHNVLAHAADDLPPFPAVAARLLKITRDDRISTEQVARVVETDPAIAAKVLRIVNSAAFGSLRRISSIRHAVVLLGTSEIRSVAMGVALFESIVNQRRTSAFDHVFFWKHSLAIAGICRIMAEETGYPDPDEAYVAGLIHDVGKIQLDAADPVGYGRFAAGLNDDTGLLHDKEHRLFGLGHDEIGAYLCNHWNLPDRLVLSTLFHHRRFAHLSLPAEHCLLISIVALADFIAWLQGVGSFNTPGYPIFHADIEPAISLDRIDLQALMQRMDREVNNTADFYGFTFPSADQFRENLLRTNIRMGQVNTAYYYRQHDLKKKIESLTMLRESITRPYQSLDSKKIILTTLEAIHQDFKFERLTAMETDPVYRNLTAIESLDTTDLPVDLSRLNLNLKEHAGDLLDCLRHCIPVIINRAGTRNRKLLEILKTPEIGIVPFSLANKVIGVIIVDNPITGRPVRLSDLTAVSLVAKELDSALENAKLFKETENRASYDGLTGIYNRSSVESCLMRAFEQAKTQGGGFSVAMVDVDHFKLFNDTFGHLAGDSVLKLIAGTLIKFSRPSEIVGRFGGEEFLCILNNTGAQGAANYCERMRDKIQDLGHLLAKRFPGHALTVSIGVATYQDGVESPQQLVEKADQALYDAKLKGRNRVEIAD